MSQKAEMGRIVRYVLGKEDAEQINRRRTTGEAIAARIGMRVILLDGAPLPGWPIGAQAHIGERVFEGDERPAMVVQSFIDGLTGEDLVNLRVMLDGTDEYWARNVKASPVVSGLPGFWHWPVRS